MPARNEPRQVVTFRTSPEIRAKLIEAAEREHRTVSSYLNVLLLEHLADEAAA